MRKLCLWFGFMDGSSEEYKYILMHAEEVVLTVVLELNFGILFGVHHS